MKKLFLAALLCLSSICNADVAQTAAEKIADKQLTILLPIDWSEGNNINLSVAIPEGFKSLQPPTEWENAMIIEFIPQNETAEQWTEIVTLIKILGKKVSATFLSDMLKNGFKTVDANLSVWLEEKDQTAGYEISRLGLSYQNVGVLEVFGSENYSGPVDCVGVQYTIKPKAGKEQETIEKVKTFFKNNAQVVNAERVKESSDLTQ